MRDRSLPASSRSSCYVVGVLGAVSLCAGYWMAGWFGTSIGSDPNEGALVEMGAEVGHEAIRQETTRVEPVVEEPAIVATGESEPSLIVSSKRLPSFDSETLGLSRLAVGRELLEAGNLEAGYTAYRDAVELYPSAQTHGALGGLYFRVAARDKAYIQFRKAVELDPYNADLWLDLANAEHMRIALGYEWKALRRAKEIDPDIVIAKDESGYYYRDENDPKAFTSSGSYTLRRIP